ncbi:MAG: acetate--CoA ligase family protein [Anaerolineae bacterium]|nr:acetate--CoA ligase family protein [Anaerolineae bacterium]
MSSLTPFFNPKGVAIIGASSNPNKLSFGIFSNLTQYGYQGGIYPINPNAKEILGLQCYPDVASIPGEVDLAVSVVSGGLTPDILKACGERGIRAVTIISGGFREVGEDGKSLEQRCLEIAHQYHMRLIGPNCVGTMDLHSGLNTTFIYGVPDKGGIGFISQSGAICGGIVDYVRSKHVGFSNFASLGNEADVTETDVIEYLATDPNTRVITVYAEGIQDGRRFLEVARRVSRTKPIVLLKAGKTNAGAKAVSSHTGSIAGSMAAYRAAFHQAGVIEVASVEELFDVALALDFQPRPSGNRTVIVTNSGGPAALASDSLAENGLVLGSLTPETQQAMRARLNPSAQVSNPVDMLGGAEPGDYRMALEMVLADPLVDAVVPILVPQALIKPEEVAHAVLDITRSTNKPVVTCFMGDRAVDGAREILHAGRVPMFTFPESVGRALGGLSTYQKWLERTPIDWPMSGRGLKKAVLPGLQQHLGQGSLGEKDTRPVFEAYDIPIVEGGFAKSADEAAQIAATINTAVVMKIVSPDILHKSDSGGIRLNLIGGESVRTAFKEMMEKVQSTHPEAHLEGVMIEKMAPKGVEVIVGMRRDPSFGPLLMFGLGGIYVELYTDVSFRVAPVSVDEAREMILDTKAGRLLTGFRGAAEADLDSVIDCIQKISRLSLDHPEIEEVEVNPLVVYPKGQGSVALDGRVILGGHA